MVTKVLGLPSLHKKIRALPEVARAEIVAAMQRAADEVVAMAKNLAPVESGDLKESIGWTWGDPPKGSIVISRSKPLKGREDMRITIFAGNDKAFYARWVEFGTAPHNVAKGGGTKAFKRTGKAGTPHPGARMHPFFYPAYRSNRKRIKSQVTRAIRKAAKKVAAEKGTLK